MTVGRRNRTASIPDTHWKRILIDTCVPLARFDKDKPERTACTEKFIELCRTGIYEIFVSPQFAVEMENKGTERKKGVNELLEELGVETLPRNEEAIELARIYAQEVTKYSEGDRLHLAYATVYECDVVVSWNMKDMVNEEIQKALRNVNQKTSRKIIMVATPATMIGEEEPL